MGFEGLWLLLKILSREKRFDGEIFNWTDGEEDVEKDTVAVIGVGEVVKDLTGVSWFNGNVGFVDGNNERKLETNR